MRGGEGHNPRVQVAQGNLWYTDNQFESQLHQPGTRAVVENRWSFFGEALGQFIAERRAGSNTRPLRLLDAGCGDGINLYGLSSRAHQEGWPLCLTGVDYNFLRVARAARIEGIEGVAHADLMRLPFRDAAFDVVLCNHVLEHITEPLVIMKEIRRILHPDGILLLGVPNEGCLVGRLRNRFIQRSILKKTDHVNFYTAPSLFRIARNAGLLPERLGGGGIFFPHSGINTVLGRFEWGARLIMQLGRWCPSQSGDLLMAARPETCAPRSVR